MERDVRYWVDKGILQKEGHSKYFKVGLLVKCEKYMGDMWYHIRGNRASLTLLSIKQLISGCMCLNASFDLLVGELVFSQLLFFFFKVLRPSLKQTNKQKQNKTTQQKKYTKRNSNQKNKLSDLHYLTNSFETISL